MDIQPYLFFDGNCAEAMRFYERALGGKLETLMKVSDAPPSEEMPPGNPDLVLHACLVVEGRMLMASDAMDGACADGTPAESRPYEGMKNFGVALSYPTVAEARRAYDALSEGATVTMPMDKTFFAEAFGMLTDRFGTPWMISGPAPQQ